MPVVTPLDPASDLVASNQCASLSTAGVQDRFCDMGLPLALCEQPRPPTATCAQEFDATRYRVFTGPDFRAVAAGRCTHNREHLVVFESEPEQMAVDNLAAQMGVVEYWLVDLNEDGVLNLQDTTLTLRKAIGL